MDNKEKILEAARRNKTRGCEYDNKESVRGDLLGMIVAVVLMIVLGLIQWFVAHSVNFGFIAAVMTMSGVQSIFQGAKTKKVYLIVWGIVQLILAVVAIIFFLGKVLAV